jgi:hypothetical protein
MLDKTDSNGSFIKIYAKFVFVALTVLLGCPGLFAMSRFLYSHLIWTQSHNKKPEVLGPC